jgi:hypothetical protein
MDDLTEHEREAVCKLLRNAIDADRFSFSDRVKTRKAALAKLDRSSGRPVPEPKPPLPPGAAPIHGNRRTRR